MQGGDCSTSVIMDDPVDHPSLGVSPPPDNGPPRGKLRQRRNRERLRFYSFNQAFFSKK
jgi:hypothetical protein